MCDATRVENATAAIAWYVGGVCVCVCVYDNKVIHICSALVIPFAFVPVSLLSAIFCKYVYILTFAGTP